MKYRAFSLLNYWDGPTEFLVVEDPEDERVRPQIYYACWEREDDNDVRTFALWSLPPRWSATTGRQGWTGITFTHPDLLVSEDEIEFSEINVHPTRADFNE